MELLFGEFIKQLIAAILAIFMPFSTVAPAVSEAAKSQITITRPPVVAQKEETPVEAVETWDVSDTESDNVTMSYYDTENQSLIDTVTSSITSLFAPMTAYAAEGDAQTYEDGTVVISGTGATEAMLFSKWLKADEFVAYYEKWCADNRVNANSYYVLKEGIDAKGHIVGNRVSAAQAHTGFATYADMLDTYFPVYLIDIVLATPNFWNDYATFNPKHIRIEGSIDTISFGAFAFCTNIEDITIATDAQTFTIESDAFAGTNISELIFPNGTQEVASNLFESCSNLSMVYLPGSVKTIANYSFNHMTDNSIIYCENEEVMNLLVDPDKGADIAADENAENGIAAYAAEAEEVESEYYDNYDHTKTSLVIAPAVQ